jgi:hypothetical protein
MTIPMNTQNPPSKPFAYDQSERIAAALQSMHIFNLNGLSFADWSDLITTNNSAPKLGLFWNVVQQALYAAPIATMLPTYVWVPINCFAPPGLKDPSKPLKLHLMQIAIKVRQGDLAPVLDGLMKAERHMRTHAPEALRALGGAQ